MRRRAEVLRIERGFAFGGGRALPRARARFGRREEGSRLVSICISLFLFGCYFFLSLIHRVAKIFICTREKKEFLDGIFFVRRLTQRRMMHLFLLSVVVFRAKPFETNARREVRVSGEEKRLGAFTRVRFQVLVSKN